MSDQITPTKPQVFGAEKAPSSGKTVALGSFSASSGIVLLLYVAKHMGLDDMTPEVAASIISLAMGIAAMIMHTQQRNQEKKETAS